MNRNIIDVPLIFARQLNVNWRPDWRGSPSAQGLDGSEQFVINRFPRWVGSPEVVMVPDMIGAWRSFVLQAEGRVNAYRIRMIDPAVMALDMSDGWRKDWTAYRSGLYREPRPQVSCVASVVAGAATITIDERRAPRPIAVGAILSHNDWPFAVTGRTGAGAAVTLSVKMLRKPIPAGAQIDMIARGIFLAGSDAMGFPDYGLDRVARPQLDLQEWITRT